MKGQSLRHYAAYMAAAALVITVACSKPTVGERCKNEGQQVCADERDSFVCVDGKWEKLTCRGAGGCKSADNDVACANDTYADGEPCDITQHEYECGADRVSVMKCKGKHWKLAGKCPGPKGCTTQKQKVSCDDSIADVGMPCAMESSAACSGDKSVLLKCKGGVMVEDTKCRGAKACDLVGGVPKCDMTIAQAGDACEREDESACATDGKQLLRCRSHVMTATQTCKACNVSGSEISCN
jgi:hypothetical protein